MAVGVTVTVTVAEAVPPVGSTTVYRNVSVPENPAAGTYVTVPAPVVLTVPCAAVPTAVTRRLVPESLPVTATATGLPAVVVAVSSTAFGATVIVTVPVVVPPLPSVTVTSNPSGPEYPGAGVYVYEPSLPTTTVPWSGVPWPVTSRSVPVEPVRTPCPAGTTSWPSAVAVASGTASTGFTVMVRVLVAGLPIASVTLTVTVSVPDQPAVGT